MYLNTCISFAPQWTVKVLSSNGAITYPKYFECAERLPGSASSAEKDMSGGWGQVWILVPASRTISIIYSTAAEIAVKAWQTQPALWALKVFPRSCSVLNWLHLWQEESCLSFPTGSLRQGEKGSHLFITNIGP